MKKKQFRTGLQLLCVLMVLLITMTAYVAGKYIKTISISGRVTFTASLATNMILQEHKAVRNPDGSYSLTANTVNENTYILIPGVDIPKDPHIIITGKTKIPAYLYIEIESSLDVPVKYTVDTSKWTLLQTDGTTSVYYYNTVIGEDFPEDPIYILTDDQVTVSQTLLEGSDAAIDVLTIQAILKEKVGGNTAAQTYKPNS